jgi:hypothetical protein
MRERNEREEEVEDRQMREREGGREIERRAKKRRE